MENFRTNSPREQHPADVFFNLLRQQKATLSDYSIYLSFRHSRDAESVFGDNPMSQSDEHGNPPFSEVYAGVNLIRRDSNTSGGNLGLINEALLDLEASLTAAEVLGGKLRKDRINIVNGWKKLILDSDPNAFADRPDLQVRLRDLK